MKPELIRDGVSLILDGIAGIDWPLDPNFKETPERVTRAYQEILSGVDNTKGQVEKVLEKSFPSRYGNIIWSSGIRTISMCPHHLLPVVYNISIAYIPCEGGQVIGASKLARLAKVLSARPVLQEDLTSDIAEALEEKIHPLGTAVVLSGRHQCMQIRGANQSEANFGTSEMLGIFRSQPETRAEFFALLANSRD